MEETEFSTEECNKKRIKQAVSVPFLWEEKPGTPKKDWKPNVIPLDNPIAPPLVKLIASVPFIWEEKPGKPLPFFTSAPVFSQENVHNWDGDAGDDERDETFESEAVASDGSETDESYTSAPSLPANRLVPTMAISSAAPVQQTSLMDSDSGQFQAPSSPASETNSSTRSYATGTTSLVGAPFLECLFPLLTPNSSFLVKVGCSEKGSSHNPQKVITSKEIDPDSNCSVVVRRPLTLGELIMMSRRRSNRRKAVQMRE